MVSADACFHLIAPAPSPEWTGEVIAGYCVHPFAARFPLMTGREFDDLVESIAAQGVVVPIELSGGMLIDGRNRLRAVEVLRQRGINIEVPVVVWSPKEGESVLRRIFDLNFLRRHLTDDQRAVLATEFLELIRAECAARQAASRFRSTGSGGSEAAPAALNSASPENGHFDQLLSSQVRFERSAVGRIASFADVSRHKAAQAVRLADDIASGLVPEEEREAVIRGEKPLRKAGVPRKRVAGKKAAPLENASLEDLFDDESFVDDAPAVTEEEVRRRWDRMKMPFAVTDHRELRRVLAAVIADEQRLFDDQ